MEFWRFADTSLDQPLVGTYDPRLVVLSVAVMALAAHTALAVVRRVNSSRRSSVRLCWRLVGATSMGIGIWAMHFTGMLAYSLPVPVSYSMILTAVSLVPAIVGSGLALAIVSGTKSSQLRLQVGGLILAVGIGAMHYTGMEAMRVEARMSYAPGMFGLSILVAYLLATLSLYVRFVFPAGRDSRGLWRWGASIIMGCAVSAMHYTAMAAATFQASPGKAIGGMGVDPGIIGAGIGLAASLILVLTGVGANVDQRLALMAQSLTDSRARQRILLDVMADGVLWLDEDGRIEDANPAACTMLGTKAGALTGAQAVEFGFEQVGRKTERVDELTRRRQLCEIEVWRRDGSTFPAEILVSSLPMRGSRMIAYVVRDISERRVAERRQQEYVAELEGARDQLRHRASELKAQAEELSKARDRAESAARAKSSFLATMSHEIRTPMNGILGTAQLLAESTLSAEQSEYVEILCSSGEALLTIINDILDYSKIEAGRLEIVPLNFDLSASVAKTADLMAGKAREKGVELILDYDTEAPRFLVGDGGRVRQVLLNLVGNALKFTSEGHVLIRVRGSEVGDGRALMRFEVHDTGIGISEEAIGRIFGAFSQADSTTTRRFGGTGLGLAICKRLVDLMGGTIGIESELGRGSLVWFELPFELGESCARSTIPAVDLNGVRALVVDDIGANLQVVRKQLLNLGMRVTEASSADEAVEQLIDAVSAGDPFRLAIVDYEMPGKSGLEVGSAVLQEGALDDLRMFLLTSSGQRGEAEVAREHGYSAYAVKPLHSDVLREMVTVLMASEARAAKPSDLITRQTVAEMAVVELPDRTAPTRVSGRVLLVEDNIVNQKLAALMLEKIGCSVDLAVNGLEALEKRFQAPYDLVFMDCQMPELDGYEATRAIRRREMEADYVPIVAMTANALPEDRERCLASGMDDYIAKPIQRQELLRLTERWLASRREARSA